MKMSDRSELLTRCVPLLLTAVIGLVGCGGGGEQPAAEKLMPAEEPAAPAVTETPTAPPSIAAPPVPNPVASTPPINGEPPTDSLQPSAGQPTTSNGDTKESLTQAFEQSFTSQDPAQMLSAAKRLYEFDKTDARSREMYVALLVQTDKSAEAIALIENEVKATPDDIALIRLQATLLFREERVDDAIKILEKSITSQPDAGELKQLYVNMMVDNDKADQAVTLFEKIRKPGPNYVQDSLVLLQLNTLVAETSSDDQATLAAVEKAAKLVREVQSTDEELGPQIESFFTQALFNEARIYGELSQLDKSIASLRDAFEAGFTNIGMLSTEEGFAALAEREDFQALVEEYREKIASKLREESREELAAHSAFDFAFELPDLEGNFR